MTYIFNPTLWYCFMVVVGHDAAFGFDGSNSSHIVGTPAKPVSRKLQ